LNSNVPKRLSTLSGVEIDFNVSAGNPDFESLIVTSVLERCFYPWFLGLRDGSSSIDPSAVITRNA
jgi:hypothetical protein